MPGLLIVSDEDLGADLAGTVLWRRDVEKRRVGADLAAARSAARDLSPNLVLLSVPEPATLPLLRGLRDATETRTAAIAVLRRGWEGLEDELHDAGANAVLAAPVDPELWDARLERLLSIPRRRETRLPVRLDPWAVTTPERTHVAGMAHNVSLRGVLLETAQPLAVGAKLDLCFRLPDGGEEILAVGEVTRDAGRRGERALSGVEFLVVRGDARSRIEAFVRRGSGADTEPVTDEGQDWESALRVSEALKSAVVEGAIDAIVTTDEEGRILEFNAAAEQLFGLPRATALGRLAADLLVPPRLRDAVSRGLAVFLVGSRRGPRRFETSALRADGTEVPVELTLSAIQLRGRRLLTGFVRDLTELHRSRVELEKSQATQRALLEVIPDVILRLSRDGTYLDFQGPPNARLSMPPEAFLGRRLEDVLPPEQAAQGRRHLEAAFETGEVQTFEQTIEIDGSLRHREVRVGRSGPDEALAIVRDVTDRRVAEERIRELAFQDPLTSLPNRTLFRDRLAVALAQAHRTRRRPSVVFVALDRFKLINESLGHAFGDRLIQAVGHRLHECLREGDTVARVGGDEFLLLLPDVTFAMDVARVAGKVVSGLRRPFEIDEREIHVTTSVGAAVYPDDGEDPDTLMQNADAALCRAKERGRDNYQLYTPAMNDRALERLSLENDLRRAVAAGSFELHYQPVVDVATRRIRSFEALLRWTHPERGQVPPSEFVPLAEAVGLIIPLGPWVLREACAQLRRWSEWGHDTVSVAINLSARQFQQPELSRQVLAVLQETGVDAGRLDIEITETSAMQSAEASIQTLRRLKGLGLHISIDDFGVGYSSLSHLRRLPIDTLKIDQSFVRDITTDPDDAAIVTTVIAMARTLKLKVVAEGVETEAQRAFLADRGCDLMQGFLFSPAVSAEECLAMLERERES